MNNNPLMAGGRSRVGGVPYTGPPNKRDAWGRGEDSVDTLVLTTFPVSG